MRGLFTKRVPSNMSLQLLREEMASQKLRRPLGVNWVFFVWHHWSLDSLWLATMVDWKFVTFSQRQWCHRKKTQWTPRGLYSFCEDISSGKTPSKAVNSYLMELSWWNAPTLALRVFHCDIIEWLSSLLYSLHCVLLKYGSEEKGSSLCKCSILLGFFMLKKLERLPSELLSEDKITNLLGFLTK